MPNLLHSLQKHDLGHLQIIADGWDLDLHAPDVRLGRKNLAAAILQSGSLLAEMIEDLPIDSQSALSDLLAQGGQVLWHIFTEKHGLIREIGPGRRDREKPHLSPISATEHLWYLGLLGRDFFDSPAGPQEFAYIPDDLQSRLPAFLRTAPEIPLLSRPAMPAERAYPIPGSDRILDDATTLLAALRLFKGQLPPDLHQQFERDWRVPPDILTALLHVAGLLDASHNPLAEPTRAFLEADRAQAMTQLVTAWLNSPDIDDLTAIPHISAEGEYTPNPLQMRRAALDLLCTLPPNEWWRLPALISAVKAQQPNFLRPKGDYDSWYLKDARTGQFLQGWADWEQVEGEYLKFLVTGPLHWLGMVDLAAGQPDGPGTAFRFSAWFDQLIQGQAPVFPWHEDQSPIMDSQGQILVPRLAPRAARYLIARFCEWGPLKREQYSYTLTPASLERAAEQGLKLEHLIGLLKRYSSSPLPPATLKALNRWQENGTEVSFQHSVVLRVTHPAILEKLQSSPARRFLGAPLGPTTITVTPGALEKVREVLISLGYLSEYRDGEQ